MKKYILLIVALLSSVSTWAYVTYKTGTITYRIYDTATTPYATVYQDSSSVKKLTGEVVIPATVTYNDVDYSVTKIDRWYYGNEVDLVLSSSISQASDISWSNVRALNSLKLPENATFTSINLTNVSYTIRTLFVPKTVTSITIPKYSSSYGARVIGAVEVDEDNPNYATIDGVLFNKAKNTLIFYPYLKSGKAYTVPSGVTTIGSNAFWYNNNLEKVTISEGVTTIEDEAFRQNSNLYECILPSTLTTIGNNAFYDASKLEKCELPANLVTIGYYAFYNCKLNPTNNLLVLPGTLKSIGEYAFYGFKNPGSTTVELPATLGLDQKETTIGEYAFNCSTIDSKMTEPINLSYYAFYYVSRIYVPQGTLNTYKEKTGWNTFSDRLIEVVPADPTLETVKLTATETIDETNTLVKVSFAADVEGAQIRYKVFSGTDNSDPSEWPIYNELGSTPAPTVDVNPNGYTIKAIATKTGMNASEIFSKSYDWASMSCKAPTIICENGSATMTISNSTAGATIEVKKYAKDTDGNYTTLVSTENYSSPIALNGNFKYVAVSKKSGMFTSSSTERTVNWFSCSQPTITYVASKPDGNTVIVTVTGTDPENEHYKYRVGSGDFLNYTAPVEVNEGSYFVAYTERENYNTSSSVSLYTYRSNITTSKPTIGVDQEAKTLTLSSDEGADIYYTLDGTTPSVKAEQKYTGVITITGNCVVNAIAHKDGKFKSDVANTSISWFACADVVITQDVINGQAVIKLSTTTEGATIRYGINGRDYYSPEYNTEYTEPFAYNSGDHIYAIAMKSGYNNSSWVDARFYYPEGTTRCAQPSIILDNEKKLVTITTSETNGVIYYTVDGSMPTTASTKYTEPFTSEVNCTIYAITSRDAETVDEVTTTYINSAVTSATLDDWFRLQNVKFVPVLGTAEGEYKMALDAEEGATIEYGINTYGGVTYTREPRDTFNVSEGDYVYAIARKPGYVDSYWSEYRVVTNNYTVNQPSINVNEETREITVQSGTEGASIYYTTSGEDPTAESSLLVGGKITVTRNDQYKFIAIKEGMYNSSVTSYKVDWFRVPQVVITPYGENNELKVELTCEDPDAKIYYGVGSNNFNSNDLTANAEYKEPFKINNGAFIYASAMKDGYNNAYTSSYGYVYDNNFRSKIPTITVAADTMVTITGDDDAVFYYTLDGSEPTIASKKFTEKFKLTENTNIRAIAVADRKLYSEINSNNYTGFYCADVVAEQIFDHGQPKMKLTTETPGATIYYGVGYYGDLVYTDPIEANDGNYIYFRAGKNKFNDSKWGSAAISYSAYTQCSQPSIYINNENRTVSMETSETNGSIYYTLDGTTPNTASTKYTEPFSPEENCTINAITARDAEEVDGQVVTYANSYVSQRNLDDWFRLSDVKFRPVLGDAEGTYRMVLEAEEGATIEYGINDEYGNTVYTDTFDVAYGAYVYAIAKKEGRVSSIRRGYRVTTDNYTVRQPAIYTNDITHVITVTTETEGADIYYTTDGTNPTTSSNKLTGSEITCTRNDSYKFMAAKSGMYNSSVSDININWFRVSDVIIEPYVADNKMMVRITCEDNKATIHYGINDFNSDNVPANAEYKAPFEIQNGDRIYASAVRSGYSNSERAYSGYIYTSNYTCKTPTITIAADTTMTITPGVDGETIYYTLDGTDPTTLSTKFVNKIKLTGNVTIKAIAVANGKLNSSINERNYNNFNVRDINFSLDGTKMTISSTTPGVTFKYQYEAEGTYSMTYPHVYSGPFDLKYNGNIYVLAEKTGYNSTTASNWVGDLVKCQVEKESYDGHTLKLKSDDGNTIWYTTNGSRPYDNTNNWYNNVYKYDGEIEIDAVGKIMAIATGSYRMESEVLEISIDSYAGETGATSEKAGGLETSMGWKKDPENITEFKVTGPINSDDMSYIKTKMTSLKRLNLSEATVDDGTIPDNAFANMPLLEFSSPNGLGKIGNNIFSGCENLAAVIWNTTAKLPDNAFDDDVNPNLLLFVPSEDAAPTNSSARNIIVNGTAKNIYLSDGEGNNFYCPQNFYTQNITYTHNFKLESGEGYGWETIALPFECSRFVHESKGELKPFAEYDSLAERDQYKPFWLRELTDIGFQDVKYIEANKPYIICMPNNDGYATRYRLGGNVTFSATNIWVPVTEPQAIQKGVNTLYANFMNNDDTDGFMLLNTEETDGHKAGSIFVKSSGRALRPFEAYVISQSTTRSMLGVARGFTADPDSDEDTTPIETVNQQTTGKMVKVYSLSGVLVKEAAEEDALKGLAKGVYIVNGKSMVVK